MSEPHIVIIGGGISGLAAAYFLSRKASAENIPLKITALEASDRFGGVLQTLRDKDLHIEAGADTFDGRDPAASDLCNALGLQRELLPCESTLNRAFISRDTNLHPVDLSFSDPAIVFRGPGLNIAGRGRLFCEILMPPKKDDSDESIASFIRRRWGREALSQWTAPLALGILMAEPERLSLREYFPHLRNMEREFGSIGLAVFHKDKKAPGGNFFTIRGGLDQLVTTLIKKLGTVELKAQAGVRTVLKRDRSWEIRLQSGSRMHADVVCVALPAPEAARLLGEVAMPLAAELAKIRYDPLLVVNMIFRSEELPESFPSGGFIVPSREKEWPFASLKVIGKTEDGKGTRLRAFVSSVFQPEAHGLGDERIQGEVLGCLAAEWGIHGAPALISVERYPRALAQYETGHAERVAGIEKLLENYPGLFLAGNGYHGFGISDCIRGAQDAAGQIVASAASKAHSGKFL